MADFNEFVQLELPRRPFVSTDGGPGQVLVRSNNPHAIRELVWSNFLNDIQGQFGGLDSEIVVVTDIDGKLQNSPITTYELEMLAGVSDNIQVQLNDRSLVGHLHSLSEITGWDGIDGGDSESIFA